MRDNEVRKVDDGDHRVFVEPVAVDEPGPPAADSSLNRGVEGAALDQPQRGAQVLDAVGAARLAPQAEAAEFGFVERQAIHRGTFGSVKGLNAKIRAFIDGWNERADPFVWTRTADDAFKKANP